MVFFYMDQSTIYQFRIKIGGLINGEHIFRLQGIVKQINDNHRKQKEYNSKKFVFTEERKHSQFFAKVQQQMLAFKNFDLGLLLKLS